LRDKTAAWLKTNPLRPGPDLFGLIDATSNWGEAGGVCAAIHVEGHWQYR
jgi:hypothetical protein